MMQKIFNKYMDLLFTSLEGNLKKIVDNQDLICKRLSEIDEVLPKKNTGDMGMMAYDACISGSDFRDEFQEKVKEDYFTKEYINPKANNTKEIFIVWGESVSKRLFKEGNETEEVKSIKGRLYLFI